MDPTTKYTNVMNAVAATTAVGNFDGVRICAMSSGKMV